MVVVLALLLALGGGYLLYVWAKIDYLSSRNFRLLATMGVQVKEAVEARDNVVKNLRPGTATTPGAPEFKKLLEPIFARKAFDSRQAFDAPEAGAIAML